MTTLKHPGLTYLDKESLQGLRTLLDGLQRQIDALIKVLKIPTDQWNALIIHIIS